MLFKERLIYISNIREHYRVRWIDSNETKVFDQIENESRGLCEINVSYN